MSGGVDSSVSAFLLKKQGLDVAGLHMNLGCGTPKNAQISAKNLKIPFKIIDSKKIFKYEVINYFINEYKNLRTPNPCVVCNKIIKFGWLLDAAEKNKFDKLATGHYVRVKKDKNGVYHLLTGKDKNKDQSYFLYRLNQSQLSKVIFPLGDKNKDDIKKIAKKYNLTANNLEESQEVCFLSGADYREFLKKYLSKKYFNPGNIVDKKGNIIGRHNGLLNYTIGQRKGIEQSNIVSDKKKKLYVIGFNKRKNELIIGENKDLLKKEVTLENLSWVSNWAKKKALENKNIKARIRYRHNPAPCNIELQKNKPKVIFKTAQKAIVPGQSLVLYSGQEVLGGGIIHSS